MSRAIKSLVGEVDPFEGLRTYKKGPVSLSVGFGSAAGKGSDRQWHGGWHPTIAATVDGKTSLSGRKGMRQISDMGDKAERAARLRETREFANTLADFMKRDAMIYRPSAYEWTATPSKAKLYKGLLSRSGSDYTLEKYGDGEHYRAVYNPSLGKVLRGDALALGVPAGLGGGAYAASEDEGMRQRLRELMGV